MSDIQRPSSSVEAVVEPAAHQEHGSGSGLSERPTTDLRSTEATSILALRGLRQALGEREHLRALTMLNHTEWRRDVQATMARAMETSPEEPGPLNSHMLVMKAFNTFDTYAPEYLQHWVSYLNDLLWLEDQL